MPLNLEQKKAVVAETAQLAINALSIVASEYHGLTVGEMTELRKLARAKGVQLRVIKNTLAKRAFADTDFSCMQEKMVGPLVYAFAYAEPGAAAQVIYEFSKDHEKLVAKLVALGGELYDSSALKRVADLPTRDQAISMLMAVMRAPVEKLARTMNAVPTKLVRTLAAVKDSKAA